MRDPRVSPHPEIRPIGLFLEYGNVKELSREDRGECEKKRALALPLAKPGLSHFSSSRRGGCSGLTSFRSGIGLPGRSSLGCLFMATKLKAHGGHDLIGKIGAAARAEALIESGGQHMSGDALIDRGGDSPASLAGVCHTSLEIVQSGALEQRAGGEIQEP